MGLSVVMTENMNVGALISQASRVIVAWETVGFSTHTGGHLYSQLSLLLDPLSSIVGYCRTHNCSPKLVHLTNSFCLAV